MQTTTRKHRKKHTVHLVKISGRAYRLLGRLRNAEAMTPCRTFKWQLEQAIELMAVEKGLIKENGRGTTNSND